MDEQYFIKKACKLIADLEDDDPDACHKEEDIRILTSFVDENLKDMYHVILMTDRVYDIQFYGKSIIIEVFDSCEFYRCDEEDE